MAATGMLRPSRPLGKVDCAQLQRGNRGPQALGRAAPRHTSTPGAAHLRSASAYNHSRALLLSLTRADGSESTTSSTKRSSTAAGAFPGPTRGAGVCPVRHGGAMGPGAVGPAAARRAPLLLRTGAPFPHAAGRPPAPGRQGVWPRASAPPQPQGTDTSADPALPDARPWEGPGSRKVYQGAVPGAGGEELGGELGAVHPDGPLPSHVTSVHQRALARLVETRQALNALIKAQPKGGTLLGSMGAAAPAELKPKDGARHTTPRHDAGVGTAVGSPGEEEAAHGLHVLGHRIRTPSVHRVPSVKDISVSAGLFAAATARSAKGVAAKHSVQRKPRKKGEGEAQAGAQKGPLRKGPAVPSWRHSQGNPFLHGNFGPVKSETVMPVKCEVIGEIPRDLRGKLLRNGPNPQYVPEEENTYHWFDGDGMVHCVEVREGEVLYSSRYVRTTGWLEERHAGRPLFTGMKHQGGIGASQLRVALLNFLQLRDQDAPYWNMTKNPSNNHLIFHAGRLLSLFEAGLPYQLDPNRLSTMGVCDFEGRWKSAVTAHPKVDPVSGHLMFYAYNLTYQPHLQYGVLSPSGELVHSCDIPLDYPIMMHDFAVTPHYTLFLDFPLRFQLQELIDTQGQAKPFAFDPSKPSRIGVMPRFGTAEDITWFPVDPGFCLHVLNAHEEQEPGLPGGDPVVVLQAFRFEAFSGLGMAEMPEHLQSHEVCRLHEYRLRLRDGAATERCIAPVCSDFPTWNTNFTGLPMRYGYSARFTTQPGPGKSVPHFDAILKHDLARGTVEAFELGPGRFAGEPVFAPKTGAEPMFATKTGADARQRRAEGTAHEQAAEGSWFAAKGPAGAPEGVSKSLHVAGTAEESVLLALAEGAESAEGGAVGGAADDEGYILVHVWDEEEQQSELLIIDAQDMGTSEPLARVILPCRVPFGFHGIYIPSKSLAK